MNTSAGGREPTDMTHVAGTGAAATLADAAGAAATLVVASLAFAWRAARGGRVFVASLAHAAARVAGSGGASGSGAAAGSGGASGSGAAATGGGGATGAGAGAATGALAATTAAGRPRRCRSANDTPANATASAAAANAMRVAGRAARGR